MKKIYGFFILFLLLGFTYAREVTVLKELSRPDTISMGNERIYITEGTSVFIYSLENHRLIKKFGKKGEGPQEFNVTPMGPPLVAYPYNHKLYVSSMAKLSVFTRDGEYLKESKVTPYIVYVPFGNSYAGTGNAANEKNQQVLSVNLYNEKFEKTKELYKSDMVVGSLSSATIDAPMSSFKFTSYKNRIYLVAGKVGFAIDVFDAKGTKLYRIKKDYEPLKLPEEYKKKTENWFKTDPNYKEYWDYFKRRISYKTYYPAIRDMSVTGDHIYVLTYKTQNDNSECIVMDLQGNEKKRVFLTCPENLGMDFNPKYTFHNRHFYTLVENQKEEVWELHKTEILK
jgi:hypothetical protein